MISNKKLLAFITVMVFAFTTISGCAGGKGASSESPDSAAVSSAPAASQSAADEPPQPADLSTAAMVGNSYLEGFVGYNILPETDCFFRVGLTIRTVFTEPMIGRDIPVIDELSNGKTYDRVFLCFGENELGWTNLQAFYDGYGDVIDAVRARQPEAAVYVQSILPVSAEVSAKNQDSTNNDRIRQFNEMLKQLASEKDAVYLDVASVMTDENGNLPDGAATDGIHPGIEYYEIWAEYLRENAILPRE